MMTAMKTRQISMTYIDGVQPVKGWNTAENAPDRPAYAGFGQEGGKTVKGGGIWRIRTRYVAHLVPLGSWQTLPGGMTFFRGAVFLRVPTQK